MEWGTSERKMAQMGLLFPIHGVVIVRRLPCPGGSCSRRWMNCGVAQERIANQPASPSTPNTHSVRVSVINYGSLYRRGTFARQQRRAYLLKSRPTRLCRVEGHFSSSFCILFLRFPIYRFLKKRRNLLIFLDIHLVYL